MEILNIDWSIFGEYAVLLPLVMGIFLFLGATKLHIHLKTSQYYTNGDWFRGQHYGMSPRGINVAQGRRPRATMIPRGDIPLCCTLNQSPFVLLYILFGRDGRIHEHKPLNYFYYASDLAWMSEFTGTKLLVSAADMLMMSTATYGY